MKYFLVLVTALLFVTSCQKSDEQDLFIDFEMLADMESELIEIIDSPYYLEQELDDIRVKDEHVEFFQEFGELMSLYSDHLGERFIDEYVACKVDRLVAPKREGVVTRDLSCYQDWKKEERSIYADTGLCAAAAGAARNVFGAAACLAYASNRQADNQQNFEDCLDDLIE